MEGNKNTLVTKLKFEAVKEQREHSTLEKDLEATISPRGLFALKKPASPSTLGETPRLPLWLPKPHAEPRQPTQTPFPVLFGMPDGLSVKKPPYATCQTKPPLLPLGIPTYGSEGNNDSAASGGKTDDQSFNKPRKKLSLNLFAAEYMEAEFDTERTADCNEFDRYATDFMGMKALSNESFKGLSYSEVEEEADYSCSAPRASQATTSFAAENRFCIRNDLSDSDDSDDEQDDSNDKTWTTAEVDKALVFSFSPPQPTKLKSILRNREMMSPYDALRNLEEEPGPLPSDDPSRLGGVEFPIIDLTATPTCMLPIPNRAKTVMGIYEDEVNWLKLLNQKWRSEFGEEPNPHLLKKGEGSPPASNSRKVTFLMPVFCHSRVASASTQGRRHRPPSPNPHAMSTRNTSQK
eukprot:Platyproteum_vivax@DN1103_c0_g1_i1.p1